MGGKSLIFTTVFMKWGLFAILFGVAPAPVIVFASFMTGPVIFVAASLVSLIMEAFSASGAAGVEIIGFFAIHFLLYVLIYYVAAGALARGLALIADGRVRFWSFAAVVVATALAGFLPVYGGAGIFGGAWGPITFFFAKLSESHFGPQAALVIYSPLVFGLTALFMYLWVRRRRDAARARPTGIGPERD